MTSAEAWDLAEAWELGAARGDVQRQRLERQAGRLLRRVVLLLAHAAARLDSLAGWIDGGPPCPRCGSVLVLHCGHHPEWGPPRSASNPPAPAPEAPK